VKKWSRETKISFCGWNILIVGDSYHVFLGAVSVVLRGLSRAQSLYLLRRPQIKPNNNSLFGERGKRLSAEQNSKLRNSTHVFHMFYIRFFYWNSHRGSEPCKGEGYCCLLIGHMTACQVYWMNRRINAFILFVVKVVGGRRRTIVVCRQVAIPRCIFQKSNCTRAI